MALVIADTGVLISLGLVKQFELLHQMFDEFYIPNAVWEEFRDYEHPDFLQEDFDWLIQHVREIHPPNHLRLVMDLGESEAIILYEQMKADVLLIDDRKARQIAESLGLKCVGSLGLLLRGKRMGIIQEIRPHLTKWLDNRRFFSKKLLNQVLAEIGEKEL